LLLGIFFSFPNLGINYTVDENGFKHYVLIPERDLIDIQLITTSLTRYEHETFDQINFELTIYEIFLLLLTAAIIQQREFFLLRYSFTRKLNLDTIQLLITQWLFTKIIPTQQNKILEKLFTNSNYRLQNIFVNTQNQYIFTQTSSKIFKNKKFSFIIFTFLIIPIIFVPIYAASGDISSSTTDSLEFDTTFGTHPYIIQVDSNTFAVIYQGNGGVGNIVTMDIDTQGNISNSVIDSLQFEATSASWPSVVAVDSDTFAIAYQDTDSDGMLITVDIDSAGNISNAIIDSLEFDTDTGIEPHIIAVDSNTFAIVYQGIWK